MYENLEPIAVQSRCHRQPFPSRRRSAATVRSQLYAAVAVTACQDTPTGVSPIERGAKNR